MRLLLLVIGAIILISCTETMNTKTINKESFSKTSGINIPENIIEFKAASEETMNLFLYSRFIISEEKYTNFLESNKWSKEMFTSESTLNFQVYNKRASWWEPSQELTAPSYLQKEEQKGKWVTSTYLAVDSAGDGNKVVYIVYTEEP